MDLILLEVNWMAIIVGTIISFIAGWLWYSDMLFGKKWRDGIGIPEDDNSSMSLAMIAQLSGTFLLAWLIAVTVELGSLQLAALVAFTLSLIIKANGLYSQKAKYAIGVESGYLFIMVIIMVLVHAIM